MFPGGVTSVGRGPSGDRAAGGAAEPHDAEEHEMTTTATTATATDTASTTSPTTADTAPRGRRVAVGAGLGAVLALVGDLAVFGLGSIGAPVRVVTGAAPDGADLGAIEVAGSAVVAVALGALCLWLLERRSPAGFRRWVAVVAAVAVVSSLPLLRLDVDAGSKVALVAMHLTTGAAAVAGQAIARSRRAGAR
jgi:hypothetical protein